MSALRSAIHEAEQVVITEDLLGALVVDVLERVVVDYEMSRHDSLSKLTGSVVRTLAKSAPDSEFLGLFGTAKHLLDRGLVVTDRTGTNLVPAQVMLLCRAESDAVRTGERTAPRFVESWNPRDECVDWARFAPRGVFASSDELRGLALAVAYLRHWRGNPAANARLRTVLDRDSIAASWQRWKGLCKKAEILWSVRRPEKPFIGDGVEDGSLVPWVKDDSLPMPDAERVPFADWWTSMARQWSASPTEESSVRDCVLSAAAALVHERQASEDELRCTVAMYARIRDLDQLHIGGGPITAGFPTHRWTVVLNVQRAFAERLTRAVHRLMTLTKPHGDAERNAVLLRDSLQTICDRLKDSNAQVQLHGADASALLRQLLALQSRKANWLGHGFALGEGSVRVRCRGYRADLVDVTVDEQAKRAVTIRSVLECSTGDQNGWREFDASQGWVEMDASMRVRLCVSR